MQASPWRDIRATSTPLRAAAPRARPFGATLYAALPLSLLIAAPTPASSANSTMVQAGGVVGLLAKVVPSVVALHTRRVLPPEGEAKAGDAPRIQRAEGSGFIVSADGFIATNKHVVHGAYDVTVVLADNRALRAKVVYQSPVIDVAFLKVESDHPLPAATFARDDALRLGQQVIAIGNPQGLGISASAGIVSALDRNLKTSPYDRYIQTDAAINPGNSGGPLFDLAGEVVGMNSISWVTAEGAGSAGLGFAIPGSSITFLIDRLKRDKHIDCGTLGFEGQQLTDSMRDALAFPGDHGVIVAAIGQGSLAARAGLRAGDVIESFNGEKLYDVTALNHAACFALGRTIAMDVWREGRTLPMRVVMTRAEDVSGSPEDRAEIAPPRFAGARDLGLTLAPIDGEMRRHYKIATGTGGFVITAVADASEAQAVGLTPGDVIKSLQMTPLSAGVSFDDAFAHYGDMNRRYVIALVDTKGGDRWITLPVHLESMRAR